MKNQYFGDVGDYGKYGLLRFIAKRGVTIAVNWYLTPDDQSNDGHIRGYLTILYVMLQLSKEYLVEDISMALKGILSKSKLEEKEFILPPIE